MIATPKYFFHSDADVRIEMIQKFLQEELRVLIRIWYPDIFILQDGQWQEFARWSMARIRIRQSEA